MAPHEKRANYPILSNKAMSPLYKVGKQGKGPTVPQCLRAARKVKSFGFCYLVSVWVRDPAIT